MGRKSTTGCQGAGACYRTDGQTRASHPGLPGRSSYFFVGSGREGTVFLVAGTLSVRSDAALTVVGRQMWEKLYKYPILHAYYAPNIFCI